MIQLCCWLCLQPSRRWRYNHGSLPKEQTLRRERGFNGCNICLEIGPFNMVVVVVFLGFILLVIFSLKFYIDDNMFPLKGSMALESWKYMFS